MSVQECPHCIRNVVFGEDGICPACRANKNILPTVSRDQIIREKQMAEMQEQIVYYEKHGPKLLITGILITLVAFFVSVVLSLNGTMFIFFSGGALVGLGIASKGYVEIRNARELKYRYHKLFG